MKREQAGMCEISTFAYLNRIRVEYVKNRYCQVLSMSWTRKLKKCWLISTSVKCNGGPLLSWKNDKRVTKILHVLDSERRPKNRVINIILLLLPIHDYVVVTFNGSIIWKQCCQLYGLLFCNRSLTHDIKDHIFEWIW